MAPASAIQEVNPNPERGLSFLLGVEYERKKEKLQQELQLDYKHHLSKKNDLKTSDALSQPQGLSLPFYERTSVKEKLQEERKKEYNLFLQEQAHIRRLKRGTAPDTSQAGRIQGSDSTFTTNTNTPPPLVECPTSRREAATMTETLDSMDRDTETGRQRHSRRRRWELYRPRDPYSSEDELLTDEEEAFRIRFRRRQDRHTLKPKNKEKRNRVSPEIKEVEAPVVAEQNNSDYTGKSNLQQPDIMKTAATSTPGISKDKAEFATGLIIGATEEKTDAQMKKEQYKQELLKQIAEQQENKMREKRLELRVAATGAKDPEKELDRIKQFEVLNHQQDSLRRDVPYKRGADVEPVGKHPNLRSKDEDEKMEQRAPPRKSQLPKKTESRMGVAQTVSPLDYFSEDYHRDFSNTLGEVSIPRVPGAAPPVPPIVPNTYNTPYDAAYYYYGTRNPLDPNPPHIQSTLSHPPSFRNDGVSKDIHQSVIPPEKLPPLKSSGHTEASHQHGTPPLEELLQDKGKQRRQRLHSYQEALKQQIKEREERKRIEKEEKERYDAKIQAEMRAYSPWGRSGGGAPIKDPKGNLISDLNQMHKSNKDSHRNPASSPEVMATHHVSGLSDQPPPQQLYMQDSYKEALKQQIEEKKRKQTEEKERMRIEEEKEERRLAEQRARIQHEYEEEQRKHKKIEQQNQSWVPEPKLHHKTVEKIVRQEKQTEEEPESSPIREERRRDLIDLNYKREPSPPIPTLQRRQTNLVASQPSSAVSQLSSRTERSASAPQHQQPPDPAQLYQPLNKMGMMSDGQEEVIRELSALRRYLRKEHKRLEGQLGQTATPEIHYTPPHRRRPRVEAFQAAHKESSSHGPTSATAHANKENIREFNHLKHRDTTSREEVRVMFPEAPTDAQSLDIQQQALLRQQQRKLRLLNREKEHDFLDHQPGSYYPRRKPEGFIHRDSMLPSENVFIDFSCSDPCAEQRSTKPVADYQERKDSRRRHDYDDVPDSADQWEPDDQCVQSATSLRVRPYNQQHMIRQDSSDPNSRTGALRGDEVDVSSLCSALGRHVSVETVATEPWLRPGTSNAVKQSSCRERPSSRTDAPPWLTHRVL